MDDPQIATKAELMKVEQQLSEVEDQIQTLLNKQSALHARKSFLKEHLKALAEQQKASHDWASDSFKWSEELREKCKTAFDITSFRPHQLETMNTTLSGLDCILIMPTGAGKSLCYQLPALLSQGLTLVISPLVSLMEDQIMSLEGQDIAATMLNANSSYEAVKTVYADMVTKQPKLRLLYVTPEKLAKSKRFMSKLEQCYKVGALARIAIDEVHCCSQWGHDFRPDYKFLGILKKQFPKVPILGLTATASRHVIVDVQKILQLPHAQIYQGSFNRANLRYSVELKPSTHSECIEKISATIQSRFAGESGIVYCCSRKDTVTVADDLNQKGIRSACYNADVDPAQRSKIHRLWSLGKMQVIVATIAFGMGIDKPDVRFVIHHSLSKSMENYYQESGRAGRDGLKSECILLYRLADVYRHSCMVFTESTGLDKLYGMVEYCTNQTTCRRELMAGHFSEVWTETSCGEMCDHCVTIEGAKSDVSSYHNPDSIADDMQLVYDILDQAALKDARLTGLKVLDAVMGKGASKNRGKQSTLRSREQCEYLIAKMLTTGCLKEEFHFTPYSTISYLTVGSRQKDITIFGVGKNSDDSTKVSKKRKKPRDTESSAKTKARMLDVADVVLLSD